MTVYFISGLGADRRIFRKLIFPHWVTVKHIDWLDPLSGETIEGYCSRLSNQIDTSEKFVIVGLSFGGMIATELRKIISPELTILVSSASTIKEIPSSYRALGKLRLDKVIPAKFLKATNFMVFWFFGIRSKEEKDLLTAMLKDQSPQFLKWAIHQIITWKNYERPSGLLHIHGKADRILPCKYTNADILISDGGHLMVYTHADQVSELLAKALAKI